MFDWEEENDERDNFLNDDIQRFESQLASNSIGFFDSDRLEGIIDHYLINGNYTKAELAADVGMKQYPFNFYFTIRCAQAMSGSGKLKEALELLDNIEKLEENLLELYLTKASIFRQLRDSKRAVNFFRKALELAENDEKDEIYLDLALELENLKDFKGAIGVLEEAMRFNPKNEGALYELAFCLDQQGNAKKAIEVYKAYLEENPYSFTAWYNLGNTFSKEGSFSDAVTAYEYCVAINDRFSPAYFNMGNAQLSLEQYKDSIDSFIKCIEIDGEDPLSYCYLGESYEQLNQLTLAWEYYQKALSLAPDLAEAWLGLGIVKDLEGKPKESLSYIERALELDPNNSSYYHVYAGALENAEMTEEAEESYLACLILEPTNEDCYFDYTDFLMEFKLGELKRFVEGYIEKYNFLFSYLPLIYLLWNYGDQTAAKKMLSDIYNADPNQARELFIRYPELQKHQELVNLTLE